MEEFDAICRRASGRRHYNSVRRLQVARRRWTLVRLLLDEPPDRKWGQQVRAARVLGVSPATICRDLAALHAEWRAARGG